MSGRGSKLIDSLFEPLTRREREILTLLEEDLSNQEIAQKLSLAVSSIKWHTQQIYGKLGVNNRRQALRRARELGLLKSDSPALTVSGMPELQLAQLLPTGTVTFLFTNIEGSTSLWEHQSGQMSASLLIHNATLHRAIESHGGIVFKIIGDAFQAAFPTALQALKAAIEGQQALQNAPWTELGPLKVRMGLHTGEAEPDPGGDGYAVSHTLNRVACVMSAAHGGQVLLSAETNELVDHQLPPGVSLKDLGKHHLKGLLQPEQIFHVLAPGLPETFPSLLSESNPNHNLPFELTSFIGRQDEIAQVQTLLREHHLVTLIGSGGVGKTRLSIQAAGQILVEFPNGVWYVEFAPLSDPNLVPQTVATVLGLREESSRPIIDTIAAFLSKRELLLILDNCEHLVAACARLAEGLLRVCPRLHLLTTSREALHLSGEQLLPIPPMSRPNPHQIWEVNDLTRYEAVELFVERAQAYQPDFKITAENAEAIVELCNLLDGLPLAIELAAARVRMLTPQAMLNLMREKNGLGSLRLLSHGSREKQARQKTLRSTIDWSYQLLDESEKVFFRRLAVFVGGFSLLAAEKVCSPINDQELPGFEMDILDGIEMLIDKNLIRPDLERGGEPRYTMLKTIQEYGLDLLENHPEAEALLERHASYYHSLARSADRYLETNEQAVWFDRLEVDHGNLLAAVRWAKNHGNAKIGFEIAIPLVIFWFVRGYLSEGRAILDELLLIQDANCHSLLRAKALDKAGFLARYQRDYDRAFSLIQESLKIHREYQDKQGEADALANLGFIMLWQGDYIQSEKYYQGSLEIYESLNNQQGMADTLVHLAMGNYYQGEYAPAQEKIERSLSIWEILGDQEGVAYALGKLGNVYLQQGLLPSAQKTLLRALVLSKDIRFQLGIAASLEGQAILATITGNYKYAFKLLGAARTVRQQFALPMAISEQLDIEAALQPAYLSMNENEAQISLNEGRRANLDDFIRSVQKDPL